MADPARVPVMRERLGRVIAAAPADTWFFLSVSAFALVLTVVYWFWTYEWAGTILLLGFSLATGLMGVRLLLGRPPRRSPEDRVADEEARREDAEHERQGRAQGAAELAVSGEERGGVLTNSATIELAPASPDADRPFLDEAGRLPAPTIAPLAIALAAALVATSIVLGPWLIIAAVLPLAWGAIGWIRDAGAEFRAVDAEDAPPEETPARGPEPAARSAPPAPATTTGGPVDRPSDSASRP